MKTFLSPALSGSSFFPALLLATMGVVAVAHADEAAIKLKPGPGMEATSANCGACHSVDYIVMNSPFLNADGWKAEVAKMRGPFGAPIDQSAADEILNYLLSTYATPAKS